MQTKVRKGERLASAEVPKMMAIRESNAKDGRGEHGLPEVEALGNQGCSQGDPQDGDIGGEPDPEELAGRPGPLVLGHGFDASLLNPGEDGALFWCS